MVILVNLLILVILVNLLILVIPSDYGESGNTGESVDSGKFVDSVDSGETSYYGKFGDFDEPGDGFGYGESVTIPVESITMLLSIAMLPSPVSWHSAVYVELGLKQNLVSRPANGSPSIVSFMYTQLSLSTSFV